MAHSSPEFVQQSRSAFTVFTLVFVLSCGIIRADETESPRLCPTQGTVIDPNSVFLSADSCAITSCQKAPSNSSSLLSDSSVAQTETSPMSAWFRGQSTSRRNQHQRVFGASQSDAVSSSLMKLVSLETPPSPETSATASDPQAPAAPIYVMQQPTFQQVEGNAFAGTSTTQGTWVLIAPYAWISGVQGQVGVGNHVVDVNVTPGDVLSHLGKADGALMLHTEVGKGDWGFILDANLIQASTSVTTVPAQVGVTLKQTLLEALGMYRFMEVPDFMVEGKSATVDFLAGGRYYEFGNQLTIQPFNPMLPTVPANLTTTWVDLIIGGRAQVPITNSLSAFARGDIGGFGIGNSSILSWNLIAGGDWKMTSCASLVAGYRELNINKGGGVGGTAFDFNAKLYGPFLAVAFQF